MRKGKVLVTGLVFTLEEHLEKLRRAGYELDIQPNPKLSEAELVKLVKGKVGYILGGTEQVTDKVIKAADQLKVISFTGVGWEAVLTGWQAAKKRGIVISNAPGGNAVSVAEFSVTMALIMQRRILELGRGGDKISETTTSINGLNIGLVGAGNIGTKIAQMIRGFEPGKIVYHNKSKKSVAEEFGGEYTDMDTLARESDIIFVSVPMSAGQLLNKQRVQSMKENALVINVSPLESIDMDALYERLESGTVRGAFDWPPPEEKYKELSPDVFFYTNSHTAYNTVQTKQRCSELVLQSFHNLMETGKDKNRIV